MAQATFEEISASDYASMYNQGYSIVELAKTLGSTYTPTRNFLLKNGADEQKAKGQGRAHLGVFKNHKSKEEVLEILNSWYNEGGIRLGTSDI